MAQSPTKQRIQWLAVHGVIRGISKVFARQGDPQGRLVADRAGLMTFDHQIANELLRSDDFRVSSLGGNLPKPLQWVLRHTATGLLHPLEPPSMLHAVHLGNSLRVARMP